MLPPKGQDQEDRPAYTINEWCFEARVSVPLYFKEQREGRGPRVAHMGRRTIITESPRAFYIRREREASVQRHTTEVE